MKALEKAAKDRVDTSGNPAAARPDQAPGARGGLDKVELILEPVGEHTAAPTVEAPLLRGRTTAASREAAQAAAMLRAQRAPGGGIFGYLRDRPLLVFGALAMLFMAGFGGYVYVQMNPGLFAKQAQRPAPVAPAPAPAAATGSSAVSPAAQPVPLTSLLPPPQPIAEVEKSAPATPPAAKVRAAAPAPKATAAANDAAPALVAVATSPSPRDTIKVTVGSATPTVNPVLAQAYSALTAGNLESAQRLYSQQVTSDPRDIEAQLGLAAIAIQQGDRDTATRHYVKVLELDPRNTIAQAGLINMVGSADPLSAETRVKQLIARDPTAAYLHFTLGNTYIDQKRWPDAQQAFFQAYHLQPDNPDYAYNLAVALEHIGQAKLALDFYRRAVTLAAAKGRANFSPAAAQERAGKLEKFVQ